MGEPGGEAWKNPAVAECNDGGKPEGGEGGGRGKTPDRQQTVSERFSRGPLPLSSACRNDVVGPCNAWAGSRPPLPPSQLLVAAGPDTVKHLVVCLMRFTWISLRRDDGCVATKSICPFPVMRLKIGLVRDVERRFVSGAENKEFVGRARRRNRNAGRTRRRCGGMSESSRKIKDGRTPGKRKRGGVEESGSRDDVAAKGRRS